MKRAVNVASTLLMVGGIALLVYVGVSYIRLKQSDTTTNASGWTASQRDRGRAIAQQLARHQILVAPRHTATRLPRPGSEAAVRMVIPRISLDAPVVETAPVNGEWQVADWSVGHLTTTANPGVAGNDALSAHDDIKGEIFKRLGELAPGDNIYLYTRHAVYTYTVYNQSTVDPTNVSVLNPTRRATATLISCTPYWVDTQRLIVQALLKSRSAA